MLVLVLLNLVATSMSNVPQSRFVLLRERLAVLNVSFDALEFAVQPTNWHCLVHACCLQPDALHITLQLWRLLLLRDHDLEK